MRVVYRVCLFVCICCICFAQNETIDIKQAPIQELVSLSKGSIRVNDAVMDLCKQVGLIYDWRKSVKEVGELIAKDISVNINRAPFDTAMQEVLEPVKLQYLIENNNVYLVKIIEPTTITVKSNIKEAYVYLDGINKGLTNTIIRVKKDRPYDITIAKEGYRDICLNNKVFIEEGNTLLKVNFKRKGISNILCNMFYGMKDGDLSPWSIRDIRDKDMLQSFNYNKGIISFRGNPLLLDCRAELIRQIPLYLPEYFVFSFEVKANNVIVAGININYSGVRGIWDKLNRVNGCWHRVVLIHKRNICAIFIDGEREKYPTQIRRYGRRLYITIHYKNNDPHEAYFRNMYFIPCDENTVDFYIKNPNFVIQ